MQLTEKTLSSLKLPTITIHQQIQSKIFNKELGIMFHSLAIERVQQSMPGSISSTCTTISLSTWSRLKHCEVKIRILPTNHLSPLSTLCTHTFSKVKALTAKGTLIYFPIFCSRKRQPIILKFNNSFWCLPAHILNSILITYNNTPSSVKTENKWKKIVRKVVNYCTIEVQVEKVV